MRVAFRQKLRQRMFWGLVVITVLVLTGCGGGSGGSGPTPEPGEGVITISGLNPRPISPIAYGQNYWDWVPSWGNATAGSESKISALRVSMIRAGGTNNDRDNTPDKWNTAQMDTYIAYCRAVGAEPVFQVNIISGTAQEAANWVTYCNVTKGYNVKYWCIGNEPDLYADGGDIPGYTINDYIRDFKAYTAAMKAVDSSIKFFGPEFSWKYIENGTDWLTPFLQECGNLVDVVTVHYYPFYTETDFNSIQTVMSSENLTRNKISWVKNITEKICGPDKPVAMTECHLSAISTMNRVASAETFYAGLWIAETAGIALEENLWTVLWWNIGGGYGTGFLDPSTKQPRPSYYALQMYTQHFGNALLSVSGHPEVAAYASRNSSNDRTVLIMVNKTAAVQNETIKFSDIGAALPDRQYSLPAYSLTCLSIPDGGGPMECWSYTKDLADRKQPPSYQSIP